MPDWMTIPDSASSHQVSFEEQSARDQQRLEMLKAEQQQSQYPEDQSALAAEMMKTESGKSIAKYPHDENYVAPVAWHPIQDGPEWKPIQETPNRDDSSFASTNIPAMGQAMASSLGAIGKAAVMIPAGIASAIGAPTSVTDPAFEYADRIKAEADKLILSPEEQEKQTFGTKLLSSFAGALPYVAMGSAAIPAMVAGASSEMGTNLIKTGAELKDAQLASIVAGSGAYALGTIATYSPSLVKSIIATGGTSFILGGAEDKMINSILLDNTPQLAAKYQWDNLENRALDAASGAGFGAFMGVKGRMTQDRAQIDFKKEMSDRVKVLMDSVTGVLDTAMPKIAFPEPLPHETHDQAIERTIANNGSAAEVLGLMAKNKNATPEQQAHAKALYAIAHEVGLDLTKMKDEVINLDSDKPLPEGGRYYGPTDTIHRNKATGPNAEANDRYVLLHEIEHAVTYHAIDLWSNHKTAESRDNLSEAQKNLLVAVDGMARVRERARDIAAGVKATDKSLERERKLDAMDMRIEIIQDKIKHGESMEDANHTAEENADFFNKHYGLIDLHEFSAETITSRGFQAHLASMRVADGFGDLRQTSTSKITNLWQAFKQAVLKFHGVNSDSSLLPVALDHIFGVHNALNAELRFSETGKARTAELEALRAKATPDAATNYILQQLAFLRKESATKAEFVQRAANELPDAAWYDYLRANVDTLWNNPSQLIALAGKQSQYGGNKGAWTRFGPDLEGNIKQAFEQFGLNLDDYMDGNRVIKKLDVEDLTKFGQMFFGKDVQDLKNRGTLSGTIVRIMHDRAEYYRTMQAVIYERAKEHMTAYNELSYKDKVGVINAAVSVQSVSERKRMLEDKGQRWLSTEQLQKKGLNQEQIAAYMGLARASEFLWSTLNAAEVKRGNKKLDFIPGYMPHIWDGAFKVHMVQTHIHPNDKDMGKSYTIEVKGFATAIGAKQYADKINSGHYNSAVFAYSTKYEGKNPYHTLKIRDQTESLTGAIMEKTDAFHNNLEMPDETRAVLEKLESDTQKGITTHALERSDIKGWIGSGGMQKSLGDIVGWHGKENAKTVLLYQNYAKSVSQYFAGSMFIDEVVSRLLNGAPPTSDGRTYYGELFSKMPEMRKYIAEYGYTFSGENINHLNKADKFIQDNLVETAGLDPRLAKNTVRGLKNILSTMFLKFNPINYMANLGQPITAVSMLYLAKHMMELDNPNSKTMHPLDAFVKGVYAHLNPTAEQQSVLDWGRQQHITDPQVQAEISRSGKLEKEPSGWNPWHWNNFIEGAGRERTLLIAYEFFKDVYKGDTNAARQAAERFMGLVQVNYDKSQRPMMFTNLGIAGEYMSPFAVYRNAMIGNMQLMATVAMSNPKSMSALKPALAFLATTFLMAGIKGLPLIKEYDNIMDWLHQTFGWDWTSNTATSLLYKAHLNDAVTFGGLSGALGVNASPSMGSVSGDGLMNSALTEFLHGIAILAGASVKNLIALAVPNQNVVLPEPASTFWGAANKVAPGILKPWIMDAVRDQSKDVIPNSTGLSGNTYRTREEDIKSKMFGKQTTDEARRTYGILRDKNDQKVQKDQYNELIERIVDDKVGIKVSRRTLDMEYKLAWQINQTTPEKVIEDVKKEMQDRALTQPQKWNKAGPSGSLEERMRNYTGISGGANR